MIGKRLFIIFLMVAAITVIITSAVPAVDHQPVDVVFMTTPFGTHMYSVGAAAEQVFKKAGSWVQVKHQETPGAMYMYRYMVQNREKIKAGKIPYTVVVGGPTLVDFLAQGVRGNFRRLCRALELPLESFRATSRAGGEACRTRPHPPPRQRCGAARCASTGAA